MSLDTASLEALRKAEPGDVCRATYIISGHTVTLEGVVWDNNGALYIGGSLLRFSQGEPRDNLTAFEILAPGVFELRRQREQADEIRMVED